MSRVVRWQVQWVRLNLFLSLAYAVAAGLVEQARPQPTSLAACGHPYQAHGCQNGAQLRRRQELLTALVALNTGNRSLVSADRAAVHPIQQQAETAAMVLSVAVGAVVEVLG